MNSSTMGHDFATAVRAELAAIGTPASRLQRHQRRTRLVTIGVIAVVVAGATTGAALVVNGFPGSTTVTPVGGRVVVTHSGTATIDLGASTNESNSVIIDVTCVSRSGTISVPMTRGVVQDAAGKTSPGGTETASWDCAKRSSTVHISDGYLSPGGTSITITASAGTTWKAVARYARSTTSPWAVNAHGQSYGGANKVYGQPDLQGAQASNGKIGYIYSKDMTSITGIGCINVYKSDGTTVIGHFPFGVNGCKNPTDVPTHPSN